MLILNAGAGGWDRAGPFEKLPNEDVSDILLCNMMQVSYLSKLMSK